MSGWFRRAAILVSVPLLICSSQLSLGQDFRQLAEAASEEGASLTDTLPALLDRNKNAYVFALELALNAFDGATTAPEGRLTRPLLRRLGALCRFGDIVETCREGILTPDAAKALGQAIDGLRAAETPTAEAEAPVVEATPAENADDAVAVVEAPLVEAVTPAAPEESDATPAKPAAEVATATDVPVTQPVEQVLTIALKCGPSGPNGPFERTLSATLTGTDFLLLRGAAGDQGYEKWAGSVAGDAASIVGEYIEGPGGTKSVGFAVSSSADGRIEATGTRGPRDCSFAAAPAQ